MQRSHETQVLQNYFDINDVRTRYNPTALEAQMLNMAGIELENLGLRANREVNQSLQTVPIGLDNLGVYYSSTVPQTLLTGPDQTTFASVIGILNGNPVTVLPYDDTLPVPSRVEVDTVRNPVAMVNPILFTLIGNGDTLTQTYAVQYVTPGDFPVPNKLTLWLDMVGENIPSVTLTITGQTVPIPAWVPQQKNTTEVVTLNSEGFAVTVNRWATISAIAVRNLPLGMRLRGWSMPFNLPGVADPGRPYTTPEDRDVLYGRYWQLDANDDLLFEMYEAGLYTGLTPINSYSLPDTMVDVAVEPYTNGMYLASAATLYYVDRREYLADLSQTGLFVEPLFGLSVVPDFSKIGATRYVTLSGVPYANFANIFNYRYTVLRLNPLGVQYSILPNGSVGPMNAGWRTGSPQPVSFALEQSGDYEFRLEMQDLSGVTTFDVVPYRNAALEPLATLSLASIVDNVQGLAFDSYGQLWAWNGVYAIPIKIHYDGYVFDADTATIFVTEPYSGLNIV